MKVAVVMGGASPEHDVSLASGRGIADAVTELGHTAVPLVLDRSDEWADGLHETIDILRSVDVVLIGLHGEGGEDGRLQGFLEQLKVPYVGSGVTASAVGLDKNLTKAVLSAHGIPVTPGVRLFGAETRDAEGALQKLKAADVDFPVFVKPANGGSSFGVGRATDLASLGAAITAAAELDPQVLVEKEMIGREVDLAVLQFPDGRVEVGPALEIISDPSQPFFNATAKYDAESATQFLIPAPLEPELTEQLKRTALEVFEILGCAGLARIDFFLPADGGPVVNEINTLPGFTPASQFPRMWAANGYSYADIIGVLIDTAVAQR
ncbi:D-alanine--D-alanine ligase [Kribbella sandramycini]|uniref:D-alanine--D-alanine ligase n=1 Tax=Kribbella sandramycini TaxID=60450 RepID=A0A7Y4L421_9ACTN|nr:D-alanine--D-alanine ligase family protein [Kribbella sandramycini]MBB6566291.1 D-alanine-D-alanine ligase [Kribbella sandramycini]NOL43046.1 D-alanine--D-alanine ligase [Kribbella sandramycini]